MTGEPRGSTIIVAAPDGVRFRVAMTLALAQSALGGRVRVYCHEASVALLARAERGDEDRAALAANGLPNRLDLITMAVSSGVSLIACQTGLAIAGLAIADLAEGVEAGGMMALMADLGNDRIVTV